MTYEKIEAESQKQQQHRARLFALEAEQAAEEQAAKLAQGQFDGDDDQDMQIQKAFQQSLLGFGGTAQTSTSTEALSAGLKTLQENNEKLRKQISETQATIAAMKGEK